jgi:hypothetical protein
MQHLMAVGWLGHFPETEEPPAQLQVHVPPAEVHADSWMTPVPPGTNVAIFENIFSEINWITTADLGSNCSYLGGKKVETFVLKKNAIFARN